MTQPGALTFVTVAHAGELPLLALQARSLARNMRAQDVRAIHVYVNDRNEAEVRDRVRAMAPEYGPLADRLCVMGAADAFGGAAPPANPRGWLYRVVARYPRLQLINRGGWNGNDGWRVQQAFKLAAARQVQSPFTVFLDTKNIFIRPVALNDFVAPDGRARTRFSATSEMALRWLRASCRALDLPARAVPPEATTFITPFSVETRILRAVLEAVERRNGPVEAFFAFRLNNATEFMLINAHCNARMGGVRRVFADGIVPSFTVWGDPALLTSVLGEAAENGAKCLGLHRQALPRLEPHHHDLVARLLIDGGIIASPDDLDLLVTAMQSGTARRAA